MNYSELWNKEELLCFVFRKQSNLFNKKKYETIWLICRKIDFNHILFKENVAGPSGEGVSWRKFQFYLRDGVVICR